MTEQGEELGPLERLLELQAIDLRADQLRYQIEHHPARLALDELLARHRQITASAAPAAERVAEFAASQSKLEAEIEEMTQRIGAIETRLRAGTAGSYRDEATMSEEIASLQRRRSQLEDEELAVMEEREPFDAELANLVAADRELEQQARDRQGELVAAQGALASELEAVERSRTASATALEPALRDEYERLRQHLGGSGVARVEHGMCSGCNLALSAGERDRLAHGAPGALFHCEQCGRILVG